jgi:hypothetical protein
LFFGITLIGLIASLLEIFTCRLSDQNWVLCSLMGQVIAYRIAGFGYVPGQSYLLVAAMLMNVLFLFFADRLLRKLYARDS